MDQRSISMPRTQPQFGATVDETALTVSPTSLSLAGREFRQLYTP